MGAIYSRASQVAAVLSPESAPILERMLEASRLEEATLLQLEADDWITRAWTYQEMVNNRNVQFIAESGSPVVVDAETALNKIGEAIESYKKAHHLDSFAMRVAHPRLDSMEDLIADWMTAVYLERSAYQVMSSMDRRVSRVEKDHFHAMIGSITAELPGAADLSLPAAEYFMSVDPMAFTRKPMMPYTDVARALSRCYSRHKQQAARDSCAAALRSRSETRHVIHAPRVCHHAVRQKERPGRRRNRF